MIFDTHSHLTYKEFEKIEDEIKKMKDFWVNYSALIGNDFNDSKKAIELSNKYDCFYAVIWSVHPIDAQNYSQINNIEQELKTLIINNENNKIIWIWETWFDYFWTKDLDDKEKEKNKLIQLEAFKLHTKIALYYNLPLIIHCRNAKEDTFKYLQEFNAKKFVIHCFSEDLDFAKEIIKYFPDAYFWFTWIITYKNTQNIQEVVSKIPLEKILVETDAPFLAPQILRWKQNTSAYVKYILDKIKDLRNEDSDIIENQIFQNSLNFFWITL